jgi:hypothetical protein
MAKIAWRKKMKTKEQKRVDALMRQEAYGKLTAKQKLEKLDAKLGVDIGATKERKRLDELSSNKGGV